MLHRFLPLHPRRWSHLALLCVLLLATPAAAQRAQSDGESCTAREASRSRLVVEDGRELYVEPIAFAVSGTQMLLAGTPTFLWTTRLPFDVTQDSVFGAVIRGGQRARLIPPPIDMKLVTDIRALGRGDGTWDVVFAELEAPKTHIAEEGRVAKHWYGIFDGKAWSGLEELPRPTGARLRVRSTTPSPLVRQRDTLWMAATITTDRGDSEVVVYSRSDRGWAYELVPTYQAAYAVPASSASLGLVLLIVRGDRDADHDENSLFVFARRPTWQVIRKVVHGWQQAVYEPSLVRGPGGDIISWWSAILDPHRPRRGHNETRAVIGWSVTHDRAIATVDSSVFNVPRLIVMADGSPVWITDHYPGVGDRLELQFTRAVPHSVSVLARIPSPFEGYMGAASPGPEEIVIAGPQVNRRGDQPGLVTLLLRVRVQCLRGRAGRASR